ncbi:ABC transporter ATP-binding protein [Desulfosarcina sp. OttesenSCG-928-A07]|nr:ABC transporter ATP-binding protein [Desulfosarcina sp. OttesenSCG-928-G17]MDL2328647.1 ABC transporter ATP-binding protein [Desulfosarcina sp. OttesenSCG-928-A07]
MKATGAPIVSIQDLHHRYGNKKIYQGLSVDVEKGSVFGLLGKNGVGKSTLINILMGYLRPEKGDCLVFGEPSHNLPPETRRRIALLYEGFISYDAMRICDVEPFFAAFYPSWKKQVFYDLVSLMDVKLTQKLSTLSFGQKSQVILGLVFAQDADLLILDDYSMGLDAGYRRLFIDYLKDYLSGTDKTVLVTSHIMGDLESLVDSIVILDRKMPVYQGRMDTFCHDFRCYATSASIPETPGILRTETLMGETRIYSFLAADALERTLSVPLKPVPLTFEEKFLGYVGKY